MPLFTGLDALVFPPSAHNVHNTQPMKLKTLLIPVILLGSGPGLFYWVSADTRQASDSVGPGGGFFLEPEILERTRKLELTGADNNRVILEKTDTGHWILPESHGMPADFEKLRRFTHSLLDAGIKQQVTSNPERLARMELGRHRLVLRDHSGNTLWDAELGERGPSGGTFFRFAGDDSLYLTDNAVNPDTRTGNWIEKRPLDFTSQEISSVALDLPGRDAPLVLERKTPGGTFQVADEDGNSRREVNTSELNRLLGTLLNARFKEARDVADPDAEAAREYAREVTLRRFDGKTHTLRIGRRPAQTVNPPPESEPAKTAPPRVEASIIFDQDGNIVQLPEPENDSANGDGSHKADGKAGPVFVVYRSDDPTFPWTRISQTVSLRFPDRIHDALPETLEDLLEPRDDSGLEKSSDP